ncbi:MAG: hypothetical protein HOH19_05355 [Kordiimonadaceae bacterium]|jgi:tungstate transport system substrate-binding protein|nr:hypothetical protein [Kordiimonadaceae bacterium]MBT6031981.1 hypothetical protein [Kordiimonadaceae bacterium]
MKAKYIYTFCAFIFFFSLFLMLRTTERPLTLMATTTTEDSGLLAILIPEIEKDTGQKIQVVTFGTGKVLRSAMDGNADIILVHDPISEQEFIKNGFGKDRHSIMRNDFVLVGPTDNPAGVAKMENAQQSFEKIYRSGLPFVSRGDESGTHKAETRIWQAAEIDSPLLSHNNYIVTGTGMGRSLNIAVEKSAYILSDRASWLTFQNKSGLKILKENDPLFSNIYSIISANPEQHSHISEQNQRVIINWFLTEKSKKLIESLKFQDQILFKSLL